jgi:hypothetical protein
VTEEEFFNKLTNSERIPPIFIILISAGCLTGNSSDRENGGGKYGSTILYGGSKNV